MDRIRIALTLLLVTLLALPASAATQLYFIHSDHLGTPRVVTDQNQTIVWKGHLKPFGQVEVEIEEISHRQRFPGQIADIEAGLYYNYFRNYDPGLGRYIQSDPIGLEGGLNTYAYVGGNPLSYADPTGEAAAAVAPAAAAVGIALGVGFCALMPSHPSCDAARELGQQCLDYVRENIFEQDEDCAEERAACSELCAEAYDDPNRRKVVGGSIAQCIKNCLPERCGGEPKWKGY